LHGVLGLVVYERT